MEDFKWTEDIKASILLEPNKIYFVECGYGFDNDVIRETFNKIFGWDKVNYCLTIKPNIPNAYINLFDNDNITASMGYGDSITFSVRYDDKFIYTGWCINNYYKLEKPNGKFIPMEDFISYCIIEKVKLF